MIMEEKKTAVCEQEPVELSVVIPCFNSEGTLAELNDRLLLVLEKVGVPWEIIYVNDSSRDNTARIMKTIVHKDCRIAAIDLMFNVGQFRALICGLEHARGNYVITMDDDLQHPPEEIAKLYSELKGDSELDAVVGRYLKKGHSLFRNLGSYATQKLSGAYFNKPKNFQMTSFRCLSRPLVDLIVSHKTMFPAIGLIIMRSSNKIKSVTVEHHQRKHGHSNYSLLKLARTMLSNLFSYTSLPLKFISVLGIVISMIGFALAIYYVAYYLLNRISFPGWTTLVVLINIYSGFLLLSVGIIGEYLLKTLQEVNGYPRYHVRSIYRKAD